MVRKYFDLPSRVLEIDNLRVTPIYPFSKMLGFCVNDRKRVL